MAEALARHLADRIGLEGLEVRSAGTGAGQGEPASKGALHAVRRHGLSLDYHSSAPLSSEMVEWADRVFAMGPSHLHRIRALGGGEKAALLGAYAQGMEGSEDGGTHLAVPDPFGGNDLVYEETFETLEHYVENVLKRLAGEGTG